MSEQEIFGKASLLGTITIPLTPHLPTLVDLFGLGIR